MCSNPNPEVRELGAGDLATDDHRQILLGQQPVVMRGVASAWPAYTLWRGPGGLQHLKKLAGAAEIQVMCSDSGVYHGDMRSHSPTCCTFAEFLDSADPTASTSQQWGGQQVYLAQAPLRTSAPLPCSLTALQQDVGMPPCLKGQAVSHVNLWMSTSGARSSLHNDPYQNLLCVVRGRKAVTLFSPAMTPWLYPMPIWGESPNHSAVNFAAPDLQQHPLYAQALLGKQVAVLEAGDALFIPEGWWHQIDSAGVTMAVNFWWDSPLAALAGTPADAYCLRRLMGSLLDSRKQQLLAQVMPFHFHTAAQAGEPHGPGKRQAGQAPTQPPQCPLEGMEVDCSKGGTAQQHVDEQCGQAGQSSSDAPQSAALIEAQAVRVLALHAADAVNPTSGGPPATRSRASHSASPSGSSSSQELAADALGPTSGGTSATSNQASHSLGTSPRGCPGGQQHDALAAAPSLGLDDRITRVFAALDPLPLRRVLLALAEHFPRSLSVLLMHGLTPAAAELLTGRFEAADAQLVEQGMHQEQQSFYSRLYSVVDDPQQVLEVMLARKEEFAAAICKQLIQEVLGVPYA